MGLLGVGEVIGGAQKTGGERDELALRGRRVGAIEAGDDDLLDALHIEELEGERAAARRVEALEAVALPEPQELLGLAQLRPRKRTGEQLLGEASDPVTAALRFVDD
jgi:hypothetical protein